MITLGYRDRNVHELVCHEVAERAGIYRSHGVTVQAVEGASCPTAPLSAGLGGALVETLRGERRWRAALVHTVRPMFWLWARQPHLPSRLALAGHPENSIVWALSAKVLDQRVVLDDEGTLRFPVGLEGDRQRLRALLAEEVDAVVLGSTIAPSALMRRGLHPMLYLGDEVQFASAGVAVDLDSEVDPAELRGVLDAQRDAITLIKQSHPVAREAISALLHESTMRDAQDLLERVVAPQYGPDPVSAQDVGARSRLWLAARMGLDTKSAAGFYEEIQ